MNAFSAKVKPDRPRFHALPHKKKQIRQQAAAAAAATATAAAAGAE